MKAKSLAPLAFAEENSAWLSLIKRSDVLIPGLYEFPENREFPGIQPNFPGIPGNLLKVAAFFDFRVLLVKIWVQMLTLSLFLGK